MATYSEKLRDPRWQRRRLEVLQACDFACQVCYDTTSTLHVHHKQYFKGREPWEYEVGQLTVLCEGCHSEHHDTEDELNLVCSFLDMDGPRSRGSAAALVAGFAGIKPPAMMDPYAYYAGVLAKNLFDVAPSVNIHELIDWAELSHSHALGMIVAIRGYVDAKKTGSNS